MIIGGVLGIDPAGPADATRPPFGLEDSLLLANAASGLFVLLDEIRPQRIWMPSYLCPVIIKAALQAGVPTEFYEVDDKLSSEHPERLAIRETDAFVVIHYFGFENPMARRIAQDGRAGWVIEDSSQALLTKGLGAHGDFSLYSPRKFVGVPDGGILTQRSERMPMHIELQPPPAAWWTEGLYARLQRRDFDRGHGTRAWYERFRAAEQQHPIGRYRMSDLSKTLLLDATDYASIASRRRENYRRLAQRLASIAIYPDLPDSVVPLGFPIRVSDRDSLLRRLFDALVYPPIHWRIGGLIPERFAGSHRLAQEIMTLPCDQRYSPADMDGIADIVAMHRSMRR